MDLFIVVWSCQISARVSNDAEPKSISLINIIESGGHLLNMFCKVKGPCQMPSSFWYKSLYVPIVRHAMLQPAALFGAVPLLWSLVLAILMRNLMDFGLEKMGTVMIKFVFFWLLTRLP